MKDCASIPRISWRPCEAGCVADIGEAGDVGEGALEAEAEAGMRHCAVAVQIPLPNPPPQAGEG